MPIPERLIAQFQPSSLFHVLCKSLDGQVLFKNDENKIFFLKKYALFLSDFVDTLSYNLLNNHVHWLIRPKPSEEIKAYLTTLEPEILTPTQIKFLKAEIDFHELIEQQFNRFFISYSLSFNKMYLRKGHLFNRPFKRIEITDNSHFTQTVIYIHANAQHHRITKDFRNWRWSSLLIHFNITYFTK